MKNPTFSAEMARRHSDPERNKILNRALSDLDHIINGHDPEVDTSINNGVWDRLDKMAVEIENHIAPSVPSMEAALIAADELASEADSVINNADALGSYNDPMASLPVSVLNDLGKALSKYRAATGGDT